LPLRDKGRIDPDDGGERTATQQVEEIIALVVTGEGKVDEA
jgi:hypothetical protein